MGISIVQFRSRFGSHDNFVKAKDVSARLKDRFWNTVLMMFYLSVFYLPTLKLVVGQYKMWNQVVFFVCTSDVLQRLYSIAYKTGK